MLVITFGGKRKESLQLRPWNLNICIEKVCCEMRIGGDDISNDVITLGTCFPLRADWWKSDSSVDREPQGNRKWNSTSGDVLVANSPFFSRPAARAPRRACSQASISRMWSVCVVSWYKFQEVMFLRCLLVCINRSLGLGKVCTTPGSNLSFSNALILRWLAIVFVALHSLDEHSCKEPRSFL